MRILIIGAGGHGQVVADILLLNDSVEPVGYIDDDSALSGHFLLGLPVLAPLSQLSFIEHDAFVVAIGNNGTRAHIFGQLQSQGEKPARAIHPSAIVGRNVTIGDGTMICAGAIINTGSSIGSNVILNTGCTVDHHNEIGDHCHIAPGVHLGGDVIIGERSLVGIGATVMPGCQIGNNCIVGAGALVHRNVPNHAVVVGVPAQPINESSDLLPNRR